MRDTIKSIEYYEEYLTLNAKRLERFQHQLETLQPDNVSGKQNCAAFGALKLPPLQKYMVYLTAKNGRTIPMI